jgi:hypothetical protein
MRAASGRARQLPPDLPRRRVLSVHSLPHPLGIRPWLADATRTVKVQLSVKVLLIERFDGFRVWRRNVPVAHVVPHHRPVLRLRQAFLLACLGRDLVCSISSLFNSLATV